MADVFTKAQRSIVMSRVRGRDNVSTELRTASLLRTFKISGWRRHAKMFGKPDFVFPSCKVALFVDGCFWHSCPTCYTAPKSSAAFWRAKRERNTLRDLDVSRELRERGWKVIRVWECQLESPSRFLNRLKKTVSSRR